VTPKPIKWASLSARQKKEFLISANRIAARLAPRLSKRFGDNVVSVGVGFRTKGKQKRTYKELVIRFYVREKWRKGVNPNGKPIPPFFSTVLKRTAGKSIKVNLPTDVNKLPKGRLHRTTVQVEGNNGAVTGSICCVVEDHDTSEIFLLSCNHVFGLVGKTTQCRGEATAQIDTIDPDFTAIAGIVRQRDMARIYPDQAQYSIDAAIAKITTPNGFTRRTDGYPVQGVRRNPSAIQLGDVFKIPARSGVLTATVMALPRKYPVVVRCGGAVHEWLFKRLIEYDLASDSIPGDSGSPVLDGNILIGMHFYYLAEEGRGFAMFAADIFDQTVFERNIDLFPD
jgi:hypothetical protein